MIWHIQIIDVKNNVRQQVDFEGNEKQAKALANRLHKNFKKTHKDEFLSYEKPVHGIRHLPKWQHKLIMLFLNSWKQYHMMLNNEQNRILAELRDALAHKLFSGEIEL